MRDPALHTPILGSSPAIQDVIRQARRIATTGLPIVLVGESGTGKELFAREIHRWSGVKGEFVDVNCGALPREIMESVLFGHRRGAYTGAHEDAKGLIEAANHGTLFLDELLSLPSESQPKLLRVLEQGEVRRVGEVTNRRVQVRYIAAAQPDIMQRMGDGRIRADLLYRLTGVMLSLPTLRERAQDIAEIARARAAGGGCSLDAQSVKALENYDWPGNVRELCMVIDRAMSFSEGSSLTSDIVEAAIGIGAVARPIEESGIGQSGRSYLMDVFAQNGWNAARTAKALGLGRTTLFKELKLMGISLRDERANAEARARRLSSPDSSRERSL